MSSKTITLLNRDVSKFVEQKNKLNYLSWAHAWKIFLEVYPDANYQIFKNEENLPLFGNEKIGYEVRTSVTADGLTRELWLPVLDGANKPIKDAPYKYKTKYGEKYVEGLDVYNINKTVMRCLVKNLAMFGLGLYIYAGEDLPSQSEDLSGVGQNDLSGDENNESTDSKPKRQNPKKEDNPKQDSANKEDMAKLWDKILIRLEDAGIDVDNNKLTANIKKKAFAGKKNVAELLKSAAETQRGFNDIIAPVIDELLKS